MAPARRVLRALAAATAAVALAGLTASGAAAAPSPGATSLPGSVPSWAGSKHKTGTPLGTDTVEGEIYFSLRDPAGAEATAAAVSTPGNPQHGHYLSPQQWIHAYAPTADSVGKTVDWLRSMGISIVSVPASRLFVVFRGTADQVAAAFGTSLADYAFQGQTLVGPTSAPQVPADIAPGVQAVDLGQGRLTTRPRTESPDAAAGAATATAAPPVTVPCSDYWAQRTAALPPAYGSANFPTRLCGYTPSQIQGAYGVARPGAIDATAGAGQTVAIVDAYASPTIVRDTNAWSEASGLPSLRQGQYRQIAPSPSEFADQALCGQPSGWQGEQTLDIQAVHGIAPAANILYAGGYNCGGGLDIALSTILDGRLADIVSNSYGDVGEALPPSVIQGQVNLHLQAAAEGIGLYFASGDRGDESALLGSPAPDFPASSPWVTSVGGTSLAVGQGGNYLFETAWGSTRQRVVADASGQLAYAGPLPGAFYAGAGGGTSASFAEPAYQTRLVPSSQAQGHRVSPDIASLADPYTGYRIGLSPISDDSTLATAAFAFQTVAGTSLACPLAAAQMAIAQASAHRSVGFANPALYTAAGSGGAQRDVTAPSFPLALASSTASTGSTYLVTLGRDTSLAAGPGYDDVTGLGSMTVAFARQAAQLR
ncbi:S53 family peptidase [Sinomonas susongensis]|uniref:S53 family peptidase n=1 Tax=Sinomonas susongensis TaxID=1324851 RepID=UPI001107CEB9|nr:S53 family peptidase [Sinomonas susongensis]